MGEHRAHVIRRRSIDLGRAAQGDVMQALRQILPVAIFILGMILPGVIKQNGLSEATNNAITLAVILLIAFLEVWSGGKLTGNSDTDLVAYTAVIAYLVEGPFQPLTQFLQAHTLNIIKAKPALAAVPPTSGRSNADWNPTVKDWQARTPPEK